MVAIRSYCALNSRWPCGTAPLWGGAAGCGWWSWLFGLVALGLLAADLLQDVFCVGGHGAIGVELQIFLIGLLAAGRRHDAVGFRIDRGFGDDSLTLQVVGDWLVGICGDCLVGRRSDGVGITAGFSEHDGFVGVVHAGVGRLGFA